MFDVQLITEINQKKQNQKKIETVLHEIALQNLEKKKSVIFNTIQLEHWSSRRVQKVLVDIVSWIDEQ